MAEEVEDLSWQSVVHMDLSVGSFRRDINCCHQIPIIVVLSI